MSPASEVSSLSDDVVARLHVHFDVVPDVEVRGDHRITIGWDVRLWGRHPRGARPLPGCPKCAPITRDLRAIAERLIPREPGTATCIVLPFERALYTSRANQLDDEVTVTLKVLAASDDGPPGSVMKEIRARLRRLGIPET